MPIHYTTYTYDALEFRGAGHVRIVQQHRVAYLDAPTPATWCGHAVTIVALTWGYQGERQAILGSGMRVSLGECEVGE